MVGFLGGRGGRDEDDDGFAVVVGSVARARAVGEGEVFVVEGMKRGFGRAATALTFEGAAEWWGGSGAARRRARRLFFFVRSLPKIK
jgi:hypothetical protein